MIDSELEFFAIFLKYGKCSVRYDSHRQGIVVSPPVQYYEIDENDRSILMSYGFYYSQDDNLWVLDESQFLDPEDQ